MNDNMFALDIALEYLDSGRMLDEFDIIPSVIDEVCWFDENFHSLTEIHVILEKVSIKDIFKKIKDFFVKILEFLGKGIKKIIDKIKSLFGKKDKQFDAEVKRAKEADKVPDSEIKEKLNTENAKEKIKQANEDTAEAIKKIIPDTLLDKTPSMDNIMMISKNTINLCTMEGGRSSRISIHFSDIYDVLHRLDEKCSYAKSNFAQYMYNNIEDKDIKDKIDRINEFVKTYGSDDYEKNANAKTLGENKASSAWLRGIDGGAKSNTIELIYPTNVNVQYIKSQRDLFGESIKTCELYLKKFEDVKKEAENVNKKISIVEKMLDPEDNFDYSRYMDTREKITSDLYSSHDDEKYYDNLRRRGLRALYDDLYTWSMKVGSGIRAATHYINSKMAASIRLESIALKNIKLINDLKLS